MTNCLLASFRLSPRKVVNSLFTEFLKPEYQSIFKLVLVHTLQRIVDEGNTPVPFSTQRIYQLS